ncbi:MAG: spore cortex biosynthesis protein YabQ [Acutalibacteraceae bacterium]
MPAALREELHFSWQLESPLDLLYFTAAGLISFLYLLSTVDGTLRWFVLAGEVIGAVLLRLTVYPMAAQAAALAPAALLQAAPWRWKRLLGSPVEAGAKVASGAAWVRDWRTENFQWKTRIPLENRQGFIV